MFGSLLTWFRSPEGIATAGTLAYAALSIVARYMPRTPFWNAVRSIVTDYAQKNLSTLPSNLAVRIDGSSGEVALFVGDKEVKRVPMIRIASGLEKGATIPSYQQRAADALAAAIGAINGKGGDS